MLKPARNIGSRMGGSSRLCQSRMNQGVVLSRQTNALSFLRSPRNVRVRNGLNTIQDSIMPGHKFQQVTNDEELQGLICLMSDWWLDIEQVESFEIAENPPVEAKPHILAFKAKLNGRWANVASVYQYPKGPKKGSNDGEQIMALTPFKREKEPSEHTWPPGAKDNVTPIVLMSVSGWRINSIVVSPMEVDGDATAKAIELLTALKSKAEASGAKLQLPTVEQLKPFGLDSFA